MNDTLATWVVGVVATGILGLAIFLAKFTFSGVYRRLDEIRDESNASNKEQVIEIKSIGATVQAQVTAQALADLRIARVEAENAMLRIKLDDIAKFLASDGYRKRDGLA